jgi:hypothetical protein
VRFAAIIPGRAGRHGRRTGVVVLATHHEDRRKSEGAGGAGDAGAVLPPADTTSEAVTGATPTRPGVHDRRLGAKGGQI